MWAKASIFRIGPFWPPRRTRTLVVDDGRVLTLDEPAVIDEALALGGKLGGAANLQQQRECAARSPRHSLVTRERASAPLEAGLFLAGTAGMTPQRRRRASHSTRAGSSV
jgi:hypothetical protein